MDIQLLECMVMAFAKVLVVKGIVTEAELDEAMKDIINQINAPKIITTENKAKKIIL